MTAILMTRRTKRSVVGLLLWAHVQERVTEEPRRGAAQAEWPGFFPERAIRISLTASNSGMDACMMRSKISMGRESVPFASILSFPHRCTSGPKKGKGANPSAKAAITSAVSGILSSQRMPIVEVQRTNTNGVKRRLCPVRWNALLGSKLCLRETIGLHVAMEHFV